MDVLIRLNLNKNGDFDVDLTAVHDDGDHVQGLFENDQKFSELLNSLSIRFLELCLKKEMGQF